MQVTVVWDVTLSRLVGVLMPARDMLPTSFSATVAHFYMAFHSSSHTSLPSPLATVFKVQTSNVISKMAL